MGRPVIFWFRRDLRIVDHPALRAACADSAVLPLAVLDPALTATSEHRTRRWLASLAVLDADLGGRLVVRRGPPDTVLPRLAAEIGAAAVHVSAETTPYGRRRDARVAAALGDVPVVLTGSPYAITPGRLLSQAGSPYRVFTPFLRAWREHGWPAPPPEPAGARWVDGVAGDVRLPAVGRAERAGDPAGERAATTRWERFRRDRLAGYDRQRDLPALDATSRLSVHLKYGEIHPRTLLAGLDWEQPGARRFAAELAWREFYADVLWHWPESAWRDRRPVPGLRYRTDETWVAAWRLGRTGYPFVDAGMRHLAAEGWMPNRLRMVTASFLTKDLHVWWPVGARHFRDLLADFDLASNNHGWQWVAGTGTDAAPYHRILNPVRQGLRFDPDGAYVRAWVPELRHLPGADAHEPWSHRDGRASGYPERIIDHAEERRVALELAPSAARPSG